MDFSLLIQTAKKTLEIEADALLEAKERIDSSFVEAAKIIFDTKGKLIITGVGKSGLVGSKIAATLASTGTPSFFLHPTEALHGDLGMISRGDAVLAISYSGESEELTRILPHIKCLDVPLVAMTSNQKAILARYADAVIDISVKQEACPLGVAPTSSTTLTMALGDALASVLMKMRGFQKEDFASFHPGGALGKRLYVKAKDLMRTSLPSVGVDITLKEALIKMSEGRIGHIFFVDEKKRLKGILSDGDVRRALLDKDFNMDEKAFKFATKPPKVADDMAMLASDALALIEAHKIQLLPFVDENGRLAGALHIHDLIDAGIKDG